MDKRKACKAHNVLNPDPAVEIEDPKELIKALDVQKPLLALYLPTLNPDVSIYDSATSLDTGSPRFLSSPKLVQSLDFSLTISVIQDQSGQIYGLLVDRNEPQPLVQQIVAGRTANNTEVPDGCFRKVACVGQSEVKLTFTGLKKYKRYAVWLAGENDLPGFPTRMQEKDVRMVLATTGKEAEGVLVSEVMLVDAGWSVCLGLLALVW